jgi:hypothetical protein
VPLGKGHALLPVSGEQQDFADDQQHKAKGGKRLFKLHSYLFLALLMAKVNAKEWS